jgi:hypothetical protein
MKKTLALSLALPLALSVALSAGEVAGVRMPDTATVEGKTVKLNGMGLRTKVMFKVYVAGLFLETTSHDAAAVIAADEVKRIELSILRKLAGSQITDAISEGFERNSKAQMPALKARLDKLKSFIPDVDKGDSIAMTYVPGKGTVVSVGTSEKGVIEGKDFSDALLSVWLGPNPAQEDLKKKLLGAN